MLRRLKTVLRTSPLFPHLLQLRKVLFYLRKGIRLLPASRPSFCSAPWNESAVLCDGTVVCSCFDACKTVPLGNIGDASFLEIWHGRRYAALRTAVKRGAENLFLCSRCPFMRALPASAELERNYPPIPNSYPRQLHIEPTIRCNLRCPGCDNQSTQQTRTRCDMPFETYRRLLEEVGPHLERLCFYDYGEPLLHPQAVQMLSLARQTNPAMEIWCSTNGHFLRTVEQQTALLNCGLDHIVFSVDGASQEVYEKYRLGGRFDVVLSNMRSLAARRREIGKSKPLITWRYLLFNWNDSDQEMNRARALAREIGVDRFCWMLTSVPREAWSRRFAPGTDALESIRRELF